jgi:carbonic anhydrase
MDQHGRRISRRGLIGGIGAAAGAAALGGELLGAVDARAAFERPATPRAALDALEEGNQRYRAGQWERRDYSPVGERRASDQKPFVAVLSCADSRVSPPLVFDVERGNLFAAQVAGNSVDPGMVGSLEYAVAVLDVPLIVVLGHSNCGAVKAAMAVAEGNASYPPSTYGSIGAVVDAVVPAIEALAPENRTLDRCIATNARVQARALSVAGPIIPAAIAKNKLRVVAAVYDIGTGAVELV